MNTEASNSIMVVDDEYQIRDLLQKTFEREGYKVLCAENGKEALSLLKRNPVDLVITDLIMPEKEGIETIRDIMIEFPFIKVIAISGGGRLSPGELLPIAKMLGAKRVFKKPFERSELVSAVKDLLGEVVA